MPRVESGSGQLTIKRGSGYGDKRRAYKVLIDDEQVGEVRDGEDFTTALSPGTHTVVLKIDWARSRPREVEIAAGQTATLSCRSRNPFLALYYATFGSRNYVAWE